MSVKKFLFGESPEAPRQPVQSRFGVPGAEGTTNRFYDVYRRAGARDPVSMGQGATIARGPQNQARGIQMDNISQLARIGREGSGLPRRMLELGAQRAGQQAQSLSAGTRGGSTLAGILGAQRASTQAMQGAAGQAVGADISERLGAMGQVGGLARGVRGMDIGLATSQAGFQQQAAQQNALLAQQNRELQDRTQLSSLGGITNLQGMQQQGNQAYELARLGAADPGQEGNLVPILGTVATGVGAYLGAASDIGVKSGMRPATLSGLPQALGQGFAAFAATREWKDAKDRRKKKEEAAERDKRRLDIEERRDEARSIERAYNAKKISAEERDRRMAALYPNPFERVFETGRTKDGGRVTPATRVGDTDPSTIPPEIRVAPAAIAERRPGQPGPGTPGWRRRLDPSADGPALLRSPDVAPPPLDVGPFDLSGRHMRGHGLANLILPFGRSAPVLPFAGTYSDEDTKEQIEDLGEDRSAIRDMMTKLTPYSYRYRGELDDGEEHTGVMSDDLRRSERGREMVVPDEDGTDFVDYGQGLSAMMAGLADLNSRIENLEGKKGKQRPLSEVKKAAKRRKA